MPMNKYSFISICLLSLLLTACVNNIGEEMQVGKIPMTFSVKGINSTNTKVSGNAFDKEDEIGLFATFANMDIDQDRYIDNLRLISDGNSNLIPEEEIFYPEGNTELDIIAYYPYDRQGVEPSSSLLPVSVRSDQSTSANLSASDFLVAEVPRVSGSESPIELEFEHKLTKIELVLSAIGDEDIDEMLEANPHVIASGFKTRGQYNFLSGEFEELEHAVDITPAGEWEKKGEKLVGKEFIIIPQENDEDEQALVMEWNGRIYTCPMPKMEIEGNTICEININAFQTTSGTLSAAKGSIKEWAYSTKAESDTEYDLSTIRIASLSFKDSNVYRVYHESEPVAEICKEYLLADNASLASKAIVVYPVHNDEADLSEGIVLELKDEETPIHGGRIQWDVEDNSFHYDEGTLEPVTQFYINEEGDICLSKPDSPAHVNIKIHTLRDMRSGKLQEYPIVKVGTQYWMREDLKATQYQGMFGEELRELNSLSGKTGYIEDKGSYFYPGETLLEGELAPDGWKIPDEDDWDKLIIYIHHNASIIKDGVWKKVSDDNEIFPATNLTGLSCLPYGYYTENENGKTVHMNYERNAVYWMDRKEGETTLPDNTIFLLYSQNTIAKGNNKVADKSCYRALNVRCVKKTVDKVPH